MKVLLIRIGCITLMTVCMLAALIISYAIWLKWPQAHDYKWYSFGGLLTLFWFIVFFGGAYWKLKTLSAKSEFDKTRLMKTVKGAA